MKYRFSVVAENKFLELFGSDKKEELLYNSGKISTVVALESDSVAAIRLYCDYDDCYASGWVIVVSEINDDGSVSVSIEEPWKFKEDFPVDFNGCAECLGWTSHGNQGNYNYYTEGLYITPEYTIFLHTVGSEADRVEEIEDEEDINAWINENLSEDEAAQAMEKLER